jgi:TPR repeat protein
MNQAAPSVAGILGSLTYGGIGVVKSCERAADIWRMGEAAGDAASLTGMGVYHSRNCGRVEANLTLAADYWERAAQKGCVCVLSVNLS